MFVEGENKAKEQYRLSLDSEIAEREQQLKDERKAKVDSILDSVGSLIGVGKFASVEKENAKLKAENERMKKAFAEAVKEKAEERTKALVAEKQKVHLPLKGIRRYGSFRSKRTASGSVSAKRWAKPRRRKTRPSACCRVR